jgi:predicted ester cyclase
MCGDPRRLVRAAALLVYSIFIAAALACGGSQTQQQAADTPPAPSRVLAPAERVALYEACWGHFNDRAWDRFKACYADTAESDQVDSGQPPAMGADAIVAGTKAFTGAFPDSKGRNELILIKGDHLAAISVISGTHTGTLVGANDRSIPSTNKPIGLLQGQVVQFDETGSRIVKEAFYFDTATMMAQLGLSPAPARPVMALPAAAPTIVIAKGTPAELSNVESLRAQMAAYNSHDAGGVAAFNAPDVVYHDMTMAADQNAKESYAGLLEFFKAFPDAKLVPASAWGADGYVVATGRFEATNKGPMPNIGLKKATNKPVSVGYLDITRWDGGKVKEEWLFYDGMAMAGQLGLGKK